MGLGGRGLLYYISGPDHESSVSDPFFFVYVLYFVIIFNHYVSISLFFYFSLSVSFLIYFFGKLKFVRSAESDLRKVAIASDEENLISLSFSFLSASLSFFLFFICILWLFGTKSRGSETLRSVRQESHTHLFTRIENSTKRKKKKSKTSELSSTE